MMEEEDAMIAADLTLYNNPVNQALKGATEAIALQKKLGIKHSVVETTAEKETETIVAADMTKYDTPMAELDRMAAKKQEEENRLKDVQNKVVILSGEEKEKSDNGTAIAFHQNSKNIDSIVKTNE